MAGSSRIARDDWARSDGVRDYARHVKPVDAVKHGGAIFGIIVVLMLAPSIIVSAWLEIPLWQRIALPVVGLFVWHWLHPRRQSPKEDRQ
jgi:hypothetical protein